MLSRRGTIATFFIALAIGLAVALVLPALRVELTSSAGPRRDATFIGTAGHQWIVSQWRGGLFSRDSLNVQFVGVGRPAEQDRDAQPLRDLRHAAWRSIVNEAAGTPAGPSVFINLQAWGFPFRSVVGGFANGTVPNLSWDTELAISGTSLQIPARPIWTGLLANAAIFTALAWALVILVVLAAAAARRRLRRRRGLCLHCGYSRAGLPAAAPCPECGKPAPTARPAAAPALTEPPAPSTFAASSPHGMFVDRLHLARRQ